MEENVIEQLCYTWSDIGIEEKGLGFQVRAASPGLTGQSWDFYQFIKSLAVYQLPVNVDPDTVNAPVCLALVNSFEGTRLLIHKTHVPRDRFGRSGNYFTHMLFDLPESFTARDAIRLWNAKLWQTHDVPDPGTGESVHLEQLTIKDLQKAQQKQSFNFSEIQDRLFLLIRAYLAPNREEQRVSITGTSEQIVALIWGLTHAVPATLLPYDFTFITYERDTNTNNETIVGTTTAFELQAGARRKPSMSYTPELQRQLSQDFENDVIAYAEFAVDCLVQTTDGRSPKLDILIEQAEKEGITDVESFIRLYQEATTEPSLPLPVQHPATDTPFPPVQKPPIGGSSTPSIEAPPPEEPIAPSASGNGPGLAPYQPSSSYWSEKQPFPDRSNRFFLILSGSIVLLVLISIFLTYYATSASNRITNATAVAQAQATLTAQATRIPPAMPGNSTIIGSFLSPPSPINKNTSPTIYVIVKIVGTNGSSEAGKYRLICNPPTGATCKNAQSSDLIVNTFANDLDTFILSVTLHKLQPRSYQVHVALTYKGKILPKTDSVVNITVQP